MTPAAVDYFIAALRDNRIVELRHSIGPGEWKSGLFNDAEDLITAIVNCDRQGGGVYISLNAPLPNLAVGNRMGCRALRDCDYEYVTRLPFDFDPVRPASVMATAEEMAAALSARDEFFRRMARIGWPMPAVAMSGSGAHAVFRCKLKITPDLRASLTLIYRGLAHDFATDRVHFDLSVRNPGRVWRAYGSTNRKGANSDDRPHRVISVTLPQVWRVVKPEQIVRLAGWYAKKLERDSPVEQRARAPINGRGDYSTLDAAAWFASRGSYKRPLHDGKHAVRCPWIAEHSSEDHPLDSSTVLLPPRTGLWWSFFCSHAHCAGRGIRDVMALWGDADSFCNSELRHGA